MKSQTTLHRCCAGAQSLLLICALDVQASDERLPTITITDQRGGDPEPALGYGLGRDALSSAPGSASDPMRAIQTLPGVAVNDDASAAPAIRGSRPEDNLYLVDFLPVGYLFHLGGAVSVFNDNLVERFELYPAAYGAEFAGVTGAVIDATLRDPATDAFATTLDVSFIKAGALFEGPITATQSFYLSARTSYLDLLAADQLDEDEGIEYLQFPRFTDYQGKYVWKPAAGTRLSFQVNGASDEQEIDLKENNENVRNEADLVGIHSGKTAFHSQGVVWQRKSGRDDLTLALAHSTDSEESQAASAGNSDVLVDTWTAKGRWTGALTKNHRIALGGELSEIDARYTVDFKDPGCTEFEVDCSIAESERLRSTGDVTVDVAKLYAEDTWTLNDRFALIGGLAFQRENYLDDAFVEPRLRVEYDVARDWRLTAGVGRFHQFPEFGLVERVFGNPALTHFDATHYVLGVERALADGWTWKAEAYRKNLDNLVIADPVTRYVNAGEGRSQGAELLVKKALTERFSGWLSLSLSDAERKNARTGERFDFAFDQPVIANIVGEYKLNERWSFGAKWWFHSGAPYTAILGGEPDPGQPGRYRPIYGAINAARLPDYHRLDLRADRKFAVKGIDLSAYVELINAYDQKNVAGYDYSVDYASRETVYQLPTLISFGIKAKF